MTLLDGIFIGGVIVATGCFNVAINQLSKLCSKPYYLINRTDLLSFLFTPNIANNLIRKYKYFMSFSISGVLVTFIVGLIQIFSQE